MIETSFTPPPLFFSTVLTYMYANSKTEFEQLYDTDVVHIPVEGGTYRITKQDLLRKAKQEIEEYI
jgi:hypothetical protein